MNTCTVFEYSKIAIGNPISSNRKITYLESKNFEVLLKFIQNNFQNKQISDSFAIEFNGKELVLRTKNVIGILKVSSELQIEILPKIFTNYNLTENEILSSRKIFLRLFESANMQSLISEFRADLKIEKNLPVWENIIKAFLYEVERLLRLGLRSGYRVKKDYTGAIKGRLLFSSFGDPKHILRNQIFNEYDEFDYDEALNRAIKAILMYIYVTSNSNINKKQAQYLLLRLPDLENLEIQDISWPNIWKVATGDVTYQKCLILGEYVIKGYSTILNSGTEELFTLLFKPEILFQDFIKGLLVKSFGAKEIYSQHSSYFMVSSNAISPSRTGIFKIKPDFIGKTMCFIGDAKWKVAEQNLGESAYQISDFYQILSYLTTYEHHGFFDEIPFGVIFYPASPGLGNHFSEFNLAKKYKLFICRIDLTSQNVVDFLKNAFITSHLPL